ncbi:MAG TPA: CPBP family intramembrane glutamic endopeptidase [Gemmatimonadaceae bacterium]|nr:CPBP family intramembrane glutamic endopeptidase [Gemmatimonadaceae bacterium]
MHSTTPDVLDVAYVALFTLVVLLFEHYYWWPRLRRRVESGAPGARIRAYWTIVVVQWIVTIGALLLFARHGGRPRLLYVVTPGALQTGFAIVIVAFTSWLLLAQYRTLARLEGERLDKVRARLGGVTVILPRTPDELRWFLVVALTAGICEELLYRGYAMWVFFPWAGFWGAGAISTILFGLGHLYQGRAGALRATVMGAVFVLMLILTRSLVPGMILHALIDIGGGFAGWAAFRERPLAVSH